MAGVQIVPEPRGWAAGSFRNFRVVLLILTGAMALLFLVGAMKFLPVTGDNMYPEAAGALTVHRWAQGYPLYADYRLAPYLITPFPPLWYGAMYLVAKAGWSDLDSLTMAGRLLSLLSLAGIALLAYRWNRRLYLSRQSSLLSPLLYLCFPVLMPWAVTARPDFPALLLSFGAIYWAARKRSSLWIWMSALVAAGAFLARHNSVAAPAAIVLWLLWSRRWKDAGLFSGVWILLVGSVMAIVEQSSHGLLLVNLSDAKFGGLAVTYVRDTLLRWLVVSGSGFALLLLAFALFVLLGSWRQTDDRTRLIKIYLLVGLGFAALGSAAAGAAVNHYLEPALAMAVLVPMGLAGLETSWPRDTRLPAFMTVMVLVLLIPSLEMQRSSVMHSRPDDFRPLLSLMDHREVFTDIPYLAVRTSRPQSPDLVSLTFTERAGSRASWSSAKLVGELQQRQYELVILDESADVRYDPGARYPRYPRLDSAVRTAIRQNYGLCIEVDTTYVYGRLSRNGDLRPGCPVGDGMLTPGNARGGSKVPVHP